MTIFFENKASLLSLILIGFFDQRCLPFLLCVYFSTMAKRQKPRKLNLIKEVLEEKGLTQSWLAGQLDIECRTLNRYSEAAVTWTSF